MCRADNAWNASHGKLIAASACESDPRFGKSSKVRGAGIFVSTLARKLAAAGGQLIEFGTRNTCLSQFDHVDGTLTKKPLSQRYHEFSDGTRVGRDLYSAFLARFVDNDRLEASQVRAAWPDAEALLRAASGRGFALPHVTLGVGAGRSRNPGQRVREAGEVYRRHWCRRRELRRAALFWRSQMAHDQEAPGFSRERFHMGLSAGKYKKPDILLVNQVFVT